MQLLDLLRHGHLAKNGVDAIFEGLTGCRAPEENHRDEAQEAREQWMEFSPDGRRKAGKSVVWHWSVRHQRGSSFPNAFKYPTLTRQFLKEDSSANSSSAFKTRS